jgi:hypothetical protein
VVRAGARHAVRLRRLMANRARSGNREANRRGDSQENPEKRGIESSDGER